MRILLIDDNESITTMLSKFLNSKGFETVVTNDPMKGLRHIQNESFDVILLDMSMPGFSGSDIIKILATNEILKDQNIFIFSANAYSNIQIKDLLRKEGINGCLKKPMKLDEILTAISS
jgi:DNA-binding response OmpR family regulator